MVVLNDALKQQSCWFYPNYYTLAIFGQRTQLWIQ